MRKRDGLIDVSWTGSKTGVWMNSDLIECVPNFSEGRDVGVIDSIVEAIASAGVRVLSVDPGYDTHRTVVTFAGSPDAVGEGAYLGIARASETIDMSVHQGTHPRMGATDVCPFVPVGETSMDVCIAMAESVGERVGKELGIPVYLYGAAARHDARVSLPAIRRGEYEALPDKMRQPEFAPDFGPSAFNAKSGATVIGARSFLVAWNVNLSTKDVDVAREIAQRLRSSGHRGDTEAGRFRALQGDGWYIEAYERAQVTFNILDYTITPLPLVFEACRREAKDLGVEVTGSQLIGLIPLDALVAAGRAYRESDDERVLVATAVESLGLGDLAPFEVEERVFEYAYARASGG
jgi:glutamate formiminotransferase/formiminotetrahydrofolate cyclodeaminase